jgi:hypothetical protein
VTTWGEVAVNVEKNWGERINRAFIPGELIRFRTETDTGHHHELEAWSYRLAIAETLLREAESGSRPDVRVTSLWYFRTDIGQWVSGDALLTEGAGR